MPDVRREPTFDRADDARRPETPRPPKRRIAGWQAVAALAGALLGAYLLLERPAHPPDGTVVVPQPAVDDAPAAEAAAPQSHVLPPIEAAQRVDAGSVGDAVSALVGRDAALRFLQLTNFPRRVVATLDSLGREHAPVAAWPVDPTPGRFSVTGGEGVHAVDERNAERYAPFVAFVGALDAPGVVALYRRMYPLLQQAYEELGFGGRSLHDRVLEVLRLLLSTPEPPQPLALTLTQVQGPIPSVQPWTRYRFADPGLQRLAAGQKILLRVGARHRAVLQRKLQELQAELLRVSSLAPTRP